MNPERWKQIDELFESALEWAPDQRCSRLRNACKGDEDLLREVESLLRAHEEGDNDLPAPGASAGACLLLSAERHRFSDTLLSPTGGGSPTQPEAEGGDSSLLERGDALDRYLVLNQLGRGGMGVVYSAYDPQLERKVAVKLLRPGAFGKTRASEGRARLLREAQALARLSHPNVIAVFDVGTYRDQVFIAMEYIDGNTLTRWLEEAKRPWRAVSEIFIQAGRGLVAAHAVGLIHRDFKPDNVLIGRDGRVRVLDFGLARTAQGPDLQAIAARSETVPDVARTLRDGPSQLTQPGLLMGTPAYMSPEQLLGSADARMDQFSFCVAFYEALYGELPFERNAPLVGKRKIKDPPRSSGVPNWLRRIILRGLRTDPNERYPSMEKLLTELGRDPARTRRRLLAIGLAAVLVAAGPIGYRYAKQQQSQLCQGAEEKLAGVWDDARKSAMATSFLKTGLPYASSALDQARRALDSYAKNWVAMEVDACKATRVRGEQSEELLDLRMECLGRRLAEMKSLLELLGSADAALVSRAKGTIQDLTSLEGCADVVELKAPIRPPDAGTRTQVEALRRRLASGKALLAAGKYKEGVQLLLPLSSEAKSLRYRPLEGEVLEMLGLLQERTGDFKSAEKTMREALFAAEAGRNDEVTASAAIRMVTLNYTQARYDQSLEWAERASAAIERLGGNERLMPRFLTTKGTVLQRLSQFDEALALHRKALEIADRVLGKDDPEVPRILLNIGTVYGDQGILSTAIDHYQRALEISERVIGPWHPDIAYLLNNIGLNLRVLGKSDEAMSYLSRALEIREQALGKDHPHVATTLSNIGDVLSSQKKYPEALAYYQRAIPLYEKAFGPEHPRLGWPLTGVGAAYLEMNEAPSAIGPLRRAETLRNNKPGTPTDLAKTRFALARALRKSGVQLSEARRLAQEARAAYATAGMRIVVEEIDAWLK